VQFGFVIDHSRCIGCHACTVACKAENDVPVGSFRTWVKYTETGAFPSVKRHFAVLRCNQCTAAPCVTICPVTALDKRPDGIVDVDPDRCIGCKSCMQACPYDALYINEDLGTAQKCHFCAHRTERGMAPACAIVCPTEAIIPGDFDDPTSRVAKLKAAGALEFRKTEAGTGPNVGYVEADPSTLDPGLTNLSGGFLWSNQVPGLTLDAETWRSAFDEAAARTTYDVQHPMHWGWKVWTYLFTKSIAAGVALALAVLLPFAHFESITNRAAGLLGLVGLAALGITAALLVADLKRPERFLTILLRPQWNSWLTRGAVLLTLYGAALAACTARWLLAPAGGTLVASTEVLWLVPTAVFGALAAVYTAWLFGQCKARVLWMKRGLALHLLAQAFLAGAATILVLAPLLDLVGVTLGEYVVFGLRVTALASLIAHMALMAHEPHAAPAGRRAEYARTMDLVLHGPYANERRWMGIRVGVALAAAFLLLPGGPWLWALGGLAALVGLFTEERLLVRAGQTLPIH